MILRYRLWILGLSVIMASCGVYGLKGISIPNDVETYFVDDIVRGVPNLPVDLHIQFGESLRRKVREQSRLKLDEQEPDIVFLGTISAYRISPVAPREGNTTNLNRLEIGLKIEYINYINEDDNWTKSFSAFQDFDSNGDFSSLEDDLNEAIIDDIMERVFNDAFTNW